MLDPKLVFSHHVTTAKLASFPIDSQLLLTSIFTHVLVDLSDLESQAALFAPSEHMRFVTLGKHVFSIFPYVNQRVTLFTVSQDLAVHD